MSLAQRPSCDWPFLLLVGGVVGTLWDQGVRQEGLVETALIFIQLR